MQNQQAGVPLDLVERSEMRQAILCFLSGGPVSEPSVKTLRSVYQKLCAVDGIAMSIFPGDDRIASDVSDALPAGMQSIGELALKVVGDAAGAIERERALLEAAVSDLGDRLASLPQRSALTGAR